MKRFLKIVTVAFVLISTTAISAKGQSIPFFMYGVSAGTNISNYKLISTDNQDLAKSALGYQLGVMIGLDLPILEVTAEGLWVNSKMSASSSDLNNITSNSFEVPILASIPILGPLRIKGGPSFMLYNNAKVKYSDGSKESLGVVKSSLGYVLGLGINLFSLSFDVRYNGQFNNQDTIFGTNTPSEYDIKAHNISASVGYRF